ncbi:MAG TPA: AAA family ATPase [Bacteroidetes bacterium]|nr:AAA family ATPase [Bacteroidota bacterium]
MDKAKLEKLRLWSNERIDRTELGYQRDELKEYDWDLRLMGIKGARGVGKTTLLLQHLKQQHGFDEKAIYLSLDDILFTENRLVDFVEHFHREGGQYLFLDEVHKYPDWAIEIKNIYDTYPGLQMVFTGSSMLEIHKANADMSRRAIMYHLQGLSFRQFLQLKYNIDLPVLALEDILAKPNGFIGGLPNDFRPYPLFREYLATGYYPFFMEGEKWFYDRLSATIRVVIESDFLFFQNINIRNIRKIYQLLLVIATSPPFKPNITKLSERTGIARNTLVQYLYYLEQAAVLSLLQSPRKGITLLQKPEKVFLENTNLLYSFSPGQPDIGTARETFLYNQLKSKHKINYAEKGDFLIDGKYIFEIGGSTKSRKQIAGIDNAYIIADQLDYAVGNKIPIWLFGLIY